MEASPKNHVVSADARVHLVLPVSDVFLPW